MIKNIIRENFSLSFFPNTITGAFDPTAKTDGGSSSSTGADGESASSTGGSTTGSSGVATCSANGKSGYVQEDGSCGLNPPPPPPPKPDPNIYQPFTLRMYKVPADTSGKFIPITEYNEKEKKDVPKTISQNPDENGKFTASSFLIALNEALGQCIKNEDKCYAVVILNPDMPGMPTSTIGSIYKFQLAQKPLSNQKNTNADSEYMICDKNYLSYIKNNTTTGKSNIMPNTVNCDFSNNGPITLSKGIVNPLAANSGPSAAKEKTSYQYASQGKIVEKTQPPWLLIICIVFTVLMIGGGLYYYFTQINVPLVTPIKVPTSQVLKKKGGYFFFV